MPGQMIQPFRGGGGLPYRFRFRVRAFRLFFAQQQGIGGNTQCRRQRNDAFGVGGGFTGLPFADGLPADPQPLRQPLLRITRFFTVVCNTLSQCHIFLLSG